MGLKDCTGFQPFRFCWVSGPGALPQAGMEWAVGPRQYSRVPILSYLATQHEIEAKQALVARQPRADNSLREKNSSHPRPRPHRYTQVRE